MKYLFPLALLAIFACVLNFLVVIGSRPKGFENARTFERDGKYYVSIEEKESEIPKSLWMRFYWPPRALAITVPLAFLSTIFLVLLWYKEMLRPESDEELAAGVNEIVQSGPATMRISGFSTVGGLSRSVCDMYVYPAGFVLDTVAIKFAVPFAKIPEIGYRQMLLCGALVIHNPSSFTRDPVIVYCSGAKEKLRLLNEIRAKALCEADSRR